MVPRALITRSFPTPCSSEAIRSASAIRTPPHPRCCQPSDSLEPTGTIRPYTWSSLTMADCGVASGLWALSEGILSLRKPTRTSASLSSTETKVSVPSEAS